jgi:hypothetical protein
MLVALILGAAACAGTSRHTALHVHGAADAGTTVDSGVGPTDGTDPAASTTSAPDSSTVSAAPTTSGSPGPGRGSGPGAPGPTAAPGSGATTTTAVVAPVATYAPGCLISSTTPTTSYTSYTFTKDPHFDPSTAGVTTPGAISRSSYQEVSLWNHSGCILTWQVSSPMSDCIVYASDASGHLGAIPHGPGGYLPPTVDGYSLLFIGISSSPSCSSETSGSFNVRIESHTYWITLPMVP